MKYKIITEKKNHLNKLSNKDNILEIKQNLFQELTTQSSRKIKYKDNEDYYYKCINLLKTKNNEENTIQDNDIIYKNKYINNYNILKLRNKNNYNSKTHNIKNKTLTVIKSKSNMEEDLMYIITKDQNKSKKKKKSNDNNIIFHLALPLCHYHKFNLKLPKKYTCNFKNCSCCEFKDKQNILYSENTKETSRDYIYPSIEKTQRSKKRHNNVLEKFKRKNKKKLEDEIENDTNKSNKKYIKKKVEDNFNKKRKENNNVINLRKANYGDEINNTFNSNNTKNSRNNSLNNSISSIESDKMSNISFKFKKPDETNLRMPKKIYEEQNDSLSKSFSLEMPEEVNIKDENYLKEYREFVDEKNKQSKIHFSVTYYQKLNKCYKVYCNEDKKNDLTYKAKNKNKNFEFLRYE